MTGGATSEVGLTRKNAGACSKCRFVLPPLEECAEAYFQNGSVPCRRCFEPVDVWRAALEAVNAIPGLAWGLTAAGAAVTMFTFTIEAWKFCSIDLTEHGLPSGATVLAVTYGPQGAGIFPIEWHGNSPHRRIAGTTLGVIGYPAEGAPQSGQVAVSVVWVPKQESESWLYLVDALEAAANKRYSQAVVFAQSALEIAIMPLITVLLEKNASKNAVDEFVKRSLGYGHALNILLPLICATKGLPQLPPEIRGTLNKVRKLRNRIVHSGMRAESVDPSIVGEALCAAVFGFEYLRMVSGRLLTK